jgi:hypothetical protein
MTLIDAGKVLIPEGFPNAGQPMGVLLFGQSDTIQDILSRADSLNVREAAQVLWTSLRTDQETKAVLAGQSFTTRAALFYELCVQASAARSISRLGKLSKDFIWQKYTVVGILTSKMDGLHVRVRHAAFNDRPPAEVFISWNDVALFSKNQSMSTHPETERRGQRLMPNNPNDLYRFSNPDGSRSTDPRAIRMEQHEDEEGTIRIGGRDRRVRFERDEDD